MTIADIPVRKRNVLVSTTEDASTVSVVDQEPSDRRWTRAEYHNLFDAGYFEGERVQLIEGRILVMPSMKLAHAFSLELTDRAVRRAFGDPYRVRIQMPFITADGSEPEPDVAVVAGNLRDETDHPTKALLIIEIAETSLRLDRRKARLYSLSGVADYWIVNLVDRVVEVYREPIPGGGPADGTGYALVRCLSKSEFIAPLAVPSQGISIAELLA
jgi:Uma2 family endonuclease